MTRVAETIFLKMFTMLMVLLIKESVQINLSGSRFPFASV